MTKQQILKTIRDKMQNGSGDVFTFIDWLQEFIEQEID